MTRSSLFVVCVALACEPTAPTDPAVIDDRPAVPAWTAVTVGSGACGLTLSGEAHCWGFRVPNECDVVTGCRVDAVPTRVATSLRFTHIADRGHVRCALASGAAYCWGYASGEATLGDGATRESATPIRMPFASPVTAITVGYGHQCALVEDGTAYCWGLGAGELGDGNETVLTRTVTTPTAVVTPLKFQAITAGLSHTCALAITQEAYCWGGGGLGVGARDTSCQFGLSCFHAATPQLVVGGLHWKSLSAGSQYTCGLTVDDRGYCWGGFQNLGAITPPTGVLGNGTFEGSREPVEIAGGLQFRSIHAGHRQACGITYDGEAYCWGDNDHAAVGVGHLGGQYNTPQRVLGNLRFIALDSGEFSTCGISVNFNLYCWGITYGGALGNGEIRGGYRATPTRVSAPAR
jgi:alpha-tubulin suppressor-like RCC1 family protein